jgi:hypothetical protein
MIGLPTCPLKPESAEEIELVNPWSKHVATSHPGPTATSAVDAPATEAIPTAPRIARRTPTSVPIVLARRIARLLTVSEPWKFIAGPEEAALQPGSSPSTGDAVTLSRRTAPDLDGRDSTMASLHGVRTPGCAWKWESKQQAVVLNFAEKAPAHVLVLDPLAYYQGDSTMT